MTDRDLLARLDGIVKDFPGVRANDGVDFHLEAGEIHALLGENGAGKTTLMSILAGLYRPDGGTVQIHGKPVDFRSPRQAAELGVGMVHQHFRLVDRFSVAENVTLGWHDPRFVLRPKPLEQEVGRLAESYGVRVDPGRPIWQLSVGEQQRIEILKNLYRGADILVLDEPTAVLTPQESESLFESLRRMAAGGRGVVLITHKLEEVMAIADRVTVLRGGRKVATVAKDETDRRTLALMMIGEDLGEPAVPGPRSPGERILGLEGVDAEDDRGLQALRGIGLEIREGEILGIAGVAGNGQRELAEVVVGLRPARRGRVLLRGQDVTAWPVRRRIAAGMGYAPEDRYRDGIAPSLSVADNLIARAYRTRPVSGRLLLNGREARRYAHELARRFDIRTADLDAPASSLSGGNAQKLLLARELAARPWLLVAAQPTRGLDLGAAEAARRLLLEQRDAGRAVLLFSEELTELLALSDRIAVMYEGAVVGTGAAAELDPETLGLLMAGQAL